MPELTESPQDVSSKELTQKFAEFCEGLRAEGYVKGFAGGLNEEWEKNDHSLALIVSPIIKSAQDFMRSHFGSENITLRYCCDSKHRCIGIAVMLPEDLYLPKHDTVFEFLSMLEDIFSQKIPPMAGYFVDSRTITFSDKSPLDIRAVERDYPFAE